MLIPLTALSFSVLGEDVLITGAGPIGIMATAIACHAGARHIVVTDMNPYRLELARKMGATIAHNFIYTQFQEAFAVMRPGNSGKVAMSRVD